MTISTNRLYEDLAWLWPLWGDPREYEQYCDHVERLIRQCSKRNVCSLLNVGCGGGKNAFNLKKRFAVTGIDISPQMLDLARQLNPDCQFLQADMRHFTLQDRFDAVLIDDAISYMTTEQELRAAFDRAYVHLNVGGVMVCGADETKETFRQNWTEVSRAVSTTKPENTDVVFVENAFDPDPTDTMYEATMVYLIRQRGKLSIEHDRHLLGLFSIEVWRRSLRDVGFEVHEAKYVERGTDYVTFACAKPA